MIAQRRWDVVIAVGVVLVVADGARAQPQPPPQPQATACFRTGADAAQTVGLEGTVQASADCRYALRGDGPWVELPAALVGRPVGFLDVYAALRGGGGQDDDARARFIYGRPQAAGRRSRPLESEQTLALRFCAHYLMEEELGFRLRAGDQLDIERVSSPGGDCGAASLELRVLALEGDARGPMILDREPTQVLPPGQRQLTLAHGSWAFYAAQPGSGLGLRVGQLTSRLSHTPLRDHLRAAGSPDAPKLLQASWGGADGGLVLRAGSDERLGPFLWTELRNAAAAGNLWLARASGAGERPRVVETLHVVETGDGVRLPDALVEAEMGRRYGGAAPAMSPSPAEWRGLFETLRVCVTPSYRAPQAAVMGAVVPEGAPCAPLAALAQVDAVAGEGRICVGRGMQIMSAEEAEHVAGPEACVALAPQGEAAAVAPLRFAVRGDRVRLDGIAEGAACVLLDGAPLVAVDGAYPLEASGLLEVRAGAAPACQSRQALTLARVAVLDPEREWHPVGLHVGQGPADEPAWRRIARDEATTFGYARARHSLQMRVSSSALVAAVAGGGPGQGAALTQHLPVIGGVRGALGGPPEPVLFAYVSDEWACPGEPLSTLREQLPLEPDALPVEAMFHVFLAADEGADQPPRCLARASFRVRPSRVLANTAPSRNARLELGVLGDLRAMFFYGEPAAVGAALPVAWFRFSVLSWLGFDIGASLTLAASMDDETAINRVGLGFSGLVEFGIPQIAPRLLGVGGMLHLAGSAHSQDNPVVSLVFSLNLATLVDVAGGR